MSATIHTPRLLVLSDLLARCETEMRYAGWINPEADNPQRQELYIAVCEALAQPVQEAASIIQAVTDPENQPSQYGTVTLDYHLAKLKEWEDRFEKLSDKALAQPVQPAAKVQDAKDAANETAAKAIYETWHSLRGYVPWKDGGNSLMQDEARKLVRLAAHNIGAKP